MDQLPFDTPKRGPGGDTRTPKAKVDIAKREQQIVELRLRKISFGAIGRAVGVSKVSAIKAFYKRAAAGGSNSGIATGREGRQGGASLTNGGFTPALRASVFREFHGLETDRCPLRNLPESRRGQWSEGLTATDMEKCLWLKPQLVATIEYLEWTTANHLQHPRFAGLKEIRREDLERAGERIFSVTFKAKDLSHAAEHLRAHN
jgi:ATP dependent DNA ligase-like protein